MWQSHKARSTPLCSAEEPLDLSEPRSRYENSQVWKGGLPPLNIEQGQHYLHCKSVTSCFPGKISSPHMNDKTHTYLEILLLQQFEIQYFPVCGFALKFGRLKFHQH